jgi:predicted nucleic acid-binding protein
VATRSACFRRIGLVEAGIPVIYWDASAVLSVLIKDAHSARATAAARRHGTHLLSTLAYSEVMAVIARLERERHLPPLLADASRDMLLGGPWRRLILQPDWPGIDSLSRTWPLRGADLWHMAAAVTLSRQLPELRLLTFDSRLAAASAGAGIGFTG